MTFTHADIEQRWLDLLYDELDAETRAAFEAHTSACVDCQAKVAALAATREAARTVARAQLDQPVPSVIRARLVEAATRAAVASNAVRSPGAESPPRWAWLRKRWTLPMFATLTAAMATLLLGRETIFREARRPLGETAPVEIAAPSPAEPAAEPASPLSGVGASPAGDRPGDRQGERPVERAASARRKTRGAPSEREPAREHPAKKSSPSLRDLSGLGAAPTQKPRAADAERAPAPELLEGKSAASQDNLDDLLSGGGSRSRSLRSEEDRQVLDTAPPRAVGAPAGPPPNPASAFASDGAVDPAMVDAVRADKLYAAQRWAEAARIYRHLLERFPAHRQTAVWRANLAAAQAAATNSKNDGGRFAQPPPSR